jgi:hypothetical protein
MSTTIVRSSTDIAPTISRSALTHRRGIFKKDGRVWTTPPSKQVIGRGGMVQRTADRKVRYEPCVSFADHATQERWSNAVIASLRLAHSDVLA